MLTKIFTEFHGETLNQFLAGYPLVTSLIILGFVLHFLPDVWGDKISATLSRSPLWAQIAVFVLLILIVIQIKSSDVQPFIYMQF